MNLTLERTPALTALQRVTGVVARRHTIEILSNIVLSADASGLQMRGTDLDMEIVETVACTASELGQTTLPADTLLNIVRNSDDGAQILLKATEGAPRAEVKSGRSRFNVPMLPADTFPQFPFEGFDGEFTMPAATLADMLERVRFLVGKADMDKDRPTSCVYLASHEGELHAVAACGSGVALRREPKPEGATIKAIMPQKLVDLVVGWMKGQDGDVKVAWASDAEGRADRLIRLEHGSTVLTAKLFGWHSFVDYHFALVDNRPLWATTDQDALSAALRRVQIMQDASSAAARLRLADGGIGVHASNQQAGEGEDEIAAFYDGLAADFLLTSKILGEALSSLRGDSVEIGFDAEEDAPVDEADKRDGPKVLIRNASDPGFIAMLMKRRA